MPQILQTPAGNSLRAFVEAKHFHRDIALVADFLQCGGDGLEINIAEPGPLKIPVIRVEVGEVRPRFSDDLWNGF